MQSVLEEARIMAFELIDKKFSNKLLDTLEFEIKQPQRKSILAWFSPYEKNKIYVNPKTLDDKSLYEIAIILVHEIGHAVHYNLFNFKTFRLPTERKSRYAYKDSIENFAEAFMDLCDVRLKNRTEKRNNKMLEILRRFNDKEEYIPEELVAKEDKKNKKREIIIEFLNGEVKEYESCSQAVKELNLKNKNCISSYWIKGKCLKAMYNNGISSIKYKNDKIEKKETKIREV